MSAPISTGWNRLDKSVIKTAPSALVRESRRRWRRKAQPEERDDFVERDHSGGRQRNAPLSNHARRLQTAGPDLQQADDLLPAGDADAGGHPGHPDHHDARG